MYKVPISFFPSGFTYNAYKLGSFTQDFLDYI